MKKPASPKPDWLIAIGIALAALLVYANTLGHGFTNWDDDLLITQNPRIQRVDLGLLLTPQAGKTYQPIREISYALNHALHELRPRGYHLGNVLLHALASGMLYLMLVTLLHAFGRSDVRVAGFAALLFALHPINVESVAWASSRKYGLLAVFLFAAILCHLRGGKWRIGAVVSAWAATLSSPFGVVAVALIAWLDRCRGERWDWRYLAALASPALAVIPMLMSPENAESAIQDYPGGNIFATAIVMLRCLFEYARNLLLPIWLNCRYALDFAGSIKHPGWIVAAVGLIVLCRWLWRRGDGLARFCAGWALISWLPVSNLIPISTQMADRYLYIPAVGIFLGLALIARRKPPIAIAVLLVIAGMTVSRNRVWAGSISLWESSVAANSANPIAHINLGHAWMQAGEFKAASGSFEAAVTLAPEDADALSGLAQSLARSGRAESAVSYFDRALKIQPERLRLWVNYASTLLGLGRLDAAGLAVDRAIQIGERDVQAHLVSGAIHYKKRDYVRARTSFSTALALRPGSANIAANLGQAHWQLARQTEGEVALAHMRDAVRLLPGHAGAAAALQAMEQKP